MADFERDLLDFLKNASGPRSMAEILRNFGFTAADRREVRVRLKSLERSGRIQQAGGSRWVSVATRAKTRPLTGTVQVTRRGIGFVRLDEASIERSGDIGDVRVDERDLADALDGDTVLVEVLRSGRDGAAGRIVEVIDRAHQTVVGVFNRTSPRRGEVVPRNVSFHRRISVPLPEESLNVANYDWVVAEIQQFTHEPEPLLGVVRERLGREGDHGIDVLILLRDRGIVSEFPNTVDKAAKALKVDWKAEARRRTDLRELLTMTIDPATAKDHDDALSVEALPGGGWKLWVHIADVSHFVVPDGPIDVEARDRATSVYPVDRVVPMLPEELSTDLCSLKPGTDRLAMTAELTVGRDGEITDSQFHESIIHSSHNLNYEIAQTLIEDGAPAKTPKEFQHLHSVMVELRECARALRKRRMANGALDLDIPEAQIFFHESGAVSSLGTRSRFEAHMLVEDCMLAANEAVARFLEKREIPLLYRVHETADADRLQRLVPVLKALGVKLGVSTEGTLTHQNLQAALRSIENRPAGHVIRRLILRALKRAEYSPKNGGHFGLASKSYCHFTSPIRRYPDLVVHRQLRAIVTKADLPYPADAEGKEELVALGRHCSDQERAAADAERDSMAIKSAEYLAKHVGEEFDGLISGVQAFGLYIELEPHGVEGLVSVRTLRGDHYDIDELGIALVGERTGQRFGLTDRVKVRLMKVNVLLGQLDLELADSSDSKPKQELRTGKGLRKPAGKGGYKPSSPADYGRKKGAGKRGGGKRGR